VNNARNVAILLVVAALVTFVPGGGRAADLVYAILSIVFAGGLALFAGRMYLERRVELYSLADNDRAVLYGSAGVIVVALAAASRLAATGPGALALLALFGIAAYGLFRVYAAWRQY
jgi:hypothetical protein